MTREIAKKIFNEVLLFGKARCTQAEFKELAEISIKALEQEPILDKIRAEIENDWQLTWLITGEPKYSTTSIIAIQMLLQSL